MHTDRTFPAPLSSIPVAINPLPWILDSDRGYHLDGGSLEAAYHSVAAAGFTTVQTDIPADYTAAQYQQLLNRYGLAGGPAYFAVEEEGAADAARRYADKLNALNVDLVFVAGAIAEPRFAHPARGLDHSRDRLARLTDTITEVAQIFRGASVVSALHPHVGTWVETEEETRFVLDRTSPELLRFGPDTGHLRWAGMDPATMVAEFQERVAGVHLKDVDVAAAARAAEADADYFTATEQHRLWREPGLGNLDLEHLITATISPERSRWAVIEVDVPYVGTPSESTAYSAQWVLKQPTLRLDR
jgi:inosose dehydratase